MTDSKEIFKKKRKLQILVPIVALFFVVILYVAKFEILSIVIIVALVIFSRLNWRCPKCNKYLGRGTTPKHCIHCGEELQ